MWIFQQGFVKKFSDTLKTALTRAVLANPTIKSPGLGERGEQNEGICIAKQHNWPVKTKKSRLGADEAGIE